MSIETVHEEATEAIHGYFELTYANYLVLPRTLLQSMPDEWQSQFVALLERYDAAFEHVEQAERYDVRAGVEREVGDLTDAEREYLGIAKSDHGAGDGDDDREIHYYDRDGNEMEGWERIVWPKPDPVPHYNRGRTHIEPHMGAGQDCGHRRGPVAGCWGTRCTR